MKICIIYHRSAHLENQLVHTEETLEKERNTTKKLKDSIMDTETKYSHALREVSHKWTQRQAQVREELSTVERILQGEPPDEVLSIVCFPRNIKGEERN